LLPGTVGPLTGNGEANVNEASATKKAAPNNVFRVTNTRRNLERLLCQDLSQLKRKSWIDKQFCEFSGDPLGRNVAILGENRSEHFMLYKKLEIG
jgi:hypothetical protein